MKRDNRIVLNLVRIIGQTMLLKRKSIEKEESLRPPVDRAKKTRTRKIRYAPVTLSEQGGVRYLHFGTEWIQGAMRLNNPFEIVLDYVQQMMVWMLFKENPKHIVQLGLGSAALTKFCYQHFPDAHVTAIELNPNVIEICKNAFHLPENDQRLQVIRTDAFDYIESRKNQYSTLRNFIKVVPMP